MARRIDIGAVQDAIGGILASDGTLEAILDNNPSRIIGGVYGVATFPYIAIGQSDVVDDSVQFLSAKRIRFKASIYTNEAGFEQCKDAEARVVELLDGNNFDVPDHRITGCFHATTRFMLDPEDGVRHGAVEFDIDVEPAPLP